MLNGVCLNNGVWSVKFGVTGHRQWRTSRAPDPYHKVEVEPYFYECARSIARSGDFPFGAKVDIYSRKYWNRPQVQQFINSPIKDYVVEKDYFRLEGENGLIVVGWRFDDYVKY